eukprot:m.69142 g.69142  ORF g.69142 m.69142 type:complete len:419 (+) comp12029_c0_seq1:235-1491(+)
MASVIVKVFLNNGALRRRTATVNDTQDILSTVEELVDCKEDYRLQYLNNESWCEFSSESCEVATLAMMQGRIKIRMAVHKTSVVPRLLTDPIVPLKVACASISSFRGQTQANIAKHIKFAEQAAAQGAKLVLFPEGSIQSLWCTFDPGCTTQELAQESESVPGPSTDMLTQACRRLGIAMAVGINHYGMADMPKGKALNGYAFIDGSGIVHLQHKAHPTWCEDKFYRGGGDYWDVFTWAGAPGRKFAIGICADRSYIGDNLYREVAKKGCNTFLGPSAGACHVQDWMTTDWGFYTQAQLSAAKDILTDVGYPSFRPKARDPPTSWCDLLGWKPGQTKPWASGEGLSLTAQGGILEGASFLYCDAKDVRDTVDQVDYQSLAFYMSGNAAIFKNGECLEANTPCTEDGKTNIETLIFATI